MEKETKPEYNKAILDIFFSSHKKMKVVFIKKDGSERTMICTKDFDTIPKEHRPKEKGDNDRPGRPTPPHLYSVYDQEAKGWRSFTILNIISVEAL